MADNTLLDFFWHNKINATAKEEFTCLKSTDKQSSSAQMFQQGKKETTKKFQLEILATNFANSSSTKITDAHRKRCKRQCHIQGKSFFFFCTEIKILKYKSGQIDKREPQHLM